jgi:sec-independent protein translocase protein TatA
MLAEIFGVDGLIVVLVIVVVLFGGAAIPKLARNLGSAKNEFEKGIKDGHKEGVTDPTVKATDDTGSVTQ